MKLLQSKIIAPVCLAVALISAPAIAGKDRGHGEHGKPAAHFKMFKRLGLSEAQKAQIKTIFEESKAANQSIREDRKAFREEMKALVESGAYSESEASALVAQYQDSLNQGILQAASVKAKIRAVLNEEQLAKLDKFEKRKHFGKKGKRGEERKRPQGEE